MIPDEAIEGAVTIREFLDADYVIPSHGGSFALGFTGSADDARRIIEKLRRTTK